MTGGIEIGDRYLPNMNVQVNRDLRLDGNNSVATVCLVKDGKVSVYIDKVPGYYYLEVVMDLGVFSSCFHKIRESSNVSNSYKKTHHYTKTYPDYFIKSNK
jgi:hypothetical protein